MNRFDITFLQSFEEYPSVSILMPTHRTMPEKQQDHIRLKDLIAEAKSRLLKEFKQRDITTISATLDRLYESIDYTSLLDGLALFANTDCARVYKLEFPIKKESVTIDHTFDVRDLLYALNRVPRYWIVALDEQPTRLYEGRELVLNEFINQERTGNQKTAFPLTEELPHSAQIQAVGKGDLDSAYRDARKREFYRHVDHALGDVLALESLPVVLVGTQKNRSDFMAITKHHEHIIENLEGDYVKDPLRDMASKAWKLVQRHMADDRQKRLAYFREEALGTLHGAFGLRQVWRMAYEGRIHTLFVEDNYVVSGTINPDIPEDLILTDNPEAVGVEDDLIDVLIELVLSKRGRVLFFEPHELEQYESIAAILRY